jgi:dTDP-4-dehydrorhamnose reductase
MKILILGSSGILGRTFKLFLSKKKNISICYLSRNRKKKAHVYLNDFTNFKKLGYLISGLSPTHIVNCIGVTKFNNSYDIRKQTRLINTKLPKFLSNFCLKKKIFFIHVSTDCVFSGKKGDYSDFSTKDAQDLYGITKNKGEVKNLYSTTIRTSFIGPEKKSHKSLLNWFLKQENDVNGFNNALFSGLTSLELSSIIYKFFLKKNKLYNNIINVGGNTISKYSLLKIISKVFKRKILIKKFYDFKIDRSLNSQKFRKLSKYKVKSWFVMLKELRIFMINNNYKF